MPSQEFYAILEMIVYPDVIEPEKLEAMREPAEATRHSISRLNCKPFININLN